MKKIYTTAKMDRDGGLCAKQDGGPWEALPIEPVVSVQSGQVISDAAAFAAAQADPDNPPLAPEDARELLPVARAKTLRRALQLTQEQFAARYHIPLGTLRDWEQGRATPDQPARAYLVVIANDPEGTWKALQKTPPDPAAQAARPVKKRQ